MVRNPAGGPEPVAARVATMACRADDGQVLTTDEEWMKKIIGQGLRSVVFPPGWKFT